MQGKDDAFKLLHKAYTVDGGSLMCLHLYYALYIIILCLAQ